MKIYLFIKLKILYLMFIFQIIFTDNKKFHQEKITPEKAFFFDKDYSKIKNMKLERQFFQLSNIIDNSYFEIEYESKYENIIIISNKFSNKWKVKSEKNLEKQSKLITTSLEY